MNTRLAAAIVLSIASISAGQMPDVAVAIKGGGHWADDPRLDDHNLEPSWELEMEGPGWFGGHIFLVGSLAGTQFDSRRGPVSTWTVSPVDYVQRLKFEYSLFGGKLGVRVRPWPKGDCQPYFMGGAGYYQYEEHISTETTSTWWDAVKGEFVSEVDETTRTHRRDNGFYPWCGVGFDVPIGGYSSLTGQTRWLVEVQHEWSKRHHDAEFGGWIVLTGFRFRF